MRMCDAGSGGTYESLERRRAEAAARYKAVLEDVESAQAAVEDARHALSNQQAKVASLKASFACAAHLAVSFTDEQRRAQVHVQAAQVLAQYYPNTPSLRDEGATLAAGYQRAVQQQEHLAAQCQEEIELAAVQLMQAERAMPPLEVALLQAQSRLQGAQLLAQKARAEYKLLLHAKTWTRYKW